MAEKGGGKGTYCPRNLPQRYRDFDGAIKFPRLFQVFVPLAASATWPDRLRTDRLNQRTEIATDRVFLRTEFSRYPVDLLSFEFLKSPYNLPSLPSLNWPYNFLYVSWIYYPLYWLQFCFFRRLELLWEYLVHQFLKVPKVLIPLSTNFSNQRSQPCFTPHVVHERLGSGKDTLSSRLATLADTRLGYSTQ